MSDGSPPDEGLQAFRKELAAMAARPPVRSRAALLAWIGAGIMVGAVILLVYGYAIVHGSDNPLDQRDGLAVCLAGVGLAVIGGAMFVYGAMAQFLRFWMVRLGHQLGR